MRITVKIKPNAREESVVVAADGSLRVSVKAPAAEGRANEALIRFIAGHYKVPRSSVRIILGAKAHNKLIEIIE